MNTYDQLKAQYDRTFAEHRLELVLNNEPFRAYYLRHPDGGRLNGALIQFTPEGIVISGDHVPGRNGVQCSGYDLAWFSGRKNPEYLASKFDLQRGFQAELAIAHLHDRLAELSTEDDEPSREDLRELLEALQSDDAGEHEFYSKLRDWNEDEWYLRAQGYDPDTMAKLTAIQHRFAACMGDLAKEDMKVVEPAKA